MKTAGRKLYSPTEAFDITWRALRAIPILRRSKQTGVLSEVFTERIMLAVTEVNGCAMCSYAHTRMALEAGMSEQQIRAMLAGEAEGIPEDQLSAVLFAQHMADQRGRPTAASWQRLNEVYGTEQAAGILAAIQVIMMGNTFGIPAGSLQARIQHRKDRIDPRSSIGYELVMILLVLPYVLFGAVTAGIAEALHCARIQTAEVQDSQPESI